MIYNFTLNDVSNSVKLFPVSSEKEDKDESGMLNQDHLNFKLYHSIKEVSEDWDELVLEGNKFLQTAFLSGLEEYPPKGMQSCYLGFYLNECLIGVAVCQIVHFNAESSINNLDGEEDDSPCVFKAIGRSFKKILAKRVDFTALVCGNILLTGEHGYYFDPKVVSTNSAMEILVKGIEVARMQLEKEGEKVSFTFYKDFYESSRADIQSILEKNDFHEFTVQPNMVLTCRDNWHSFADYLTDMSSKYRVKAKSARKKGKSVTKKELSVEEIKKNKQEIFNLYTNVVKNSGFNAVMLHEDYFLGLKLKLGEQYKLYGHFIKDQLVAFHTTIDDGTELEAHFLGFDPDENRKYKIYHNILFDIVHSGIEGRYKRVVFARTALEIKSSIGAEPYEMYCYLKHKRSFSNKFVKNVFDYLNDDEEWTPRHPFKS